MKSSLIILMRNNEKKSNLKVENDHKNFTSSHKSETNCKCLTTMRNVSLKLSAETLT